MRVQTCVALLVTLFATTLSASEDTNVLKLDVRKVDMVGTLEVRMSNQSTKLLRIWRDTNSWGAARWRVLRLRGSTLSLFYQDPDQDFTRNVPGATEVAAGGQKTVLLARARAG
jgi:hypothetical protein